MIRSKAIPGKSGLFTVCALAAAFAVAPYANATTVRIHFSGMAGSGYADLTVAPDPNASSNYDPNQPSSTPTLSQWDPEGAEYITHASGAFNGVAITGVRANDSGTPPPLSGSTPQDPQYETLPNSFSWLGENSYDNLFYPGNSPLVCPPSGPLPYVFHGGFLDIFGVMFALDNGDYVGLWSDGFTPPGFAGPDWPGGLTFGINTFTPNGDGSYTVTSSQFAGAVASIPVPEPGFMWLFGAGLLGLFAWRRSTEARKRRAGID